jgi:hypothetical protein
MVVPFVDHHYLFEELYFNFSIRVKINTAITLNFLKLKKGVLQGINVLSQDKAILAS